MTPKEKADFLVAQFCKWSREDEVFTPKYYAKKCALIAVEEILKHGAWIGQQLVAMDDRFDDEDTEEFWIEVKQEIEKL